MLDCAVNDEALEGGSAVLSDGDIHLEPLVASQLLQGAAPSFWNKELLEVVGDLIDPARSWALGPALLDVSDLPSEKEA